MHTCILSGLRERRSTLKNWKKIRNILCEIYMCLLCKIYIYVNNNELRDKLRDVKKRDKIITNIREKQGHHFYDVTIYYL